MRKMMTKVMTSAAALTALVAVQAHADDYETQTAAGKPSLSIGGGVLYAPEYSGSDEYEARILPLVYGQKEITPGNTLYIKGLNAGFDHKIDDQFTVGLLGNYRFARDADDSDKLTGMSDIDGAFEFGPKVRYQMTPQMGIEGNVLFDISDAHGGYTANASADYVMPLSRVTFLTIDGGLTYGSEDYNNTYYGVTSAQARPGRPAYMPDAGFASVNAGVGVKHMLTRNIALNGKLGADYLLGDVADSPLVEQELQPKLMVGATYSF